jgi:hypothetical protein
MKSITTIFLLSIAFLLVSTPLTAQLKPKVRTAAYFDKTPPLREMELIVPSTRDRSWKDKVIRNEDSGREFNDNANPLPAGPDPVWQKEFGFRGGNEVIANFDGVPNLNDVYPPDTDGDVGPDHYFQMINLSFQIFDKEGNSLFGPADNRTLWNGFIGPWTGTNDGDPIVLYDEQADRWIATQFAIHTQDGTFWELVAVSETGDPTGAYYRYAFEFPAFNDYPKVGVWPDGYYFSFNMFGNDYRRAAVCSLERDAMLTGDPGARMILFDMPDGSEPWSLLPADFDGPPPPAGTPNYFTYIIDDAFGGGDYLSVWALASDWSNPDNSTFEEVHRLDTEPFNSYFCSGSLGTCLPQPDNGPLLEVLSDRLMYRLQYRNFGSYQAMVTNHTVNVDGNGHAGIRWYEMRDLNDGNGWFIYQQGTYAPDEYHRWMGSAAMDGRGYIALGFSIVNQNKYASIRFTGRSPNDPPGLMTFYEEELMAGTGIQTGSVARWGDYSMMSVDPADDTTFWFTTEYVKVSGTVTWRTRISAFRMVEDHIAPAAVTDLTAAANTTNSVTLNWTATGDNGDEGTAFIYDIRYSTDAITPDNFDLCTPVGKTPAPAVAGTMESFTIEDLEFGMNYYFAMKVRDKQFNFSPISNIVQATTPAAPGIFIEETTVVQKIFTGSEGSRAYSLENTGASDLYYTINKIPLSTEQGNGAKAAGEILGTYSGSPNAISGLAWVNGVLYMTDLEKDFLLTYDTLLQKVMDTAIIHESPFSIAFDGELLWIGDKSGHVFAYTTEGTATGLTFDCPHNGFSSLAWNGSYFATNNIMENNPVVYLVDESGEIKGSFKAALNNMKIWQLVYADEHFNGEYWFTNNSGKIGQIKVDEEGAGNIVQVFAAPSGASYALAHDHTDLWYGKIGGTLYRIDDGTDEVNWLSASPKTGTIPAAGALDLSLGFDAQRFGPGSYFANMIIVSNDPVAAEVIVPVELQVTGISLGQDTSFCGHLSVTLDAGEGFAGYLWSDGSQAQTLLVDSLGYGMGEELVWVEVTDIGGATRRDSVMVNFLDCASIFEFPKGATVSIFPNPNDGIFEIMAKNLVDDLTVTVSDMAGKVLLQKTLSVSGGGLITSTIDLTGHDSGTYILRLSSAGRIKIEQLIVR